MTELAISGRVERVEGRINAAVALVARHWLALVNAAVGVFVGLSFLAPILMAVGISGPARLIYAVYQLTCHQLPYRSFFLGGPQAVYSQAEITALTGRSTFFELYHNPITLATIGYQVAFCQRDVAIYATIFLAGLLFALVRHQVRPLSVKLLVLLSLPMAFDGFIQLFGWHESTWELRLITGFLFGLGAVWFTYPYLELAMRDVRQDLGQPATLSPHPGSFGPPASL
jgi:uncharacterized membrane protein